MGNYFKHGDQVIVVNSMHDGYGRYGVIDEPLNHGRYKPTVDFGDCRVNVFADDLRLDDGRGALRGLHPDPQSLVDEYLVIYADLDFCDEVKTRAELEESTEVDLEGVEEDTAQWDDEERCYYVRLRRW